MPTFPVGLLRDLPPKRVMRAHVAGQDLVVWRATNGDISAWDNRCPHRGMALSHGFVRGNALACLYHGWHYGSTGVCNLIPAHPDLEPPATIKTTKFSVAEQDGVVWVSIDGPAEPHPLPMPMRPLRAFIVDADPTVFRAACLNAALQDQVPTLADTGVYQIGDMQIACLENPLDGDRTQITALAHAEATPQQCSALSRWCEAVARLSRTSAKVAA